jgi:D-3-phosphoglycerate dehydrogenase
MAGRALRVLVVGDPYFTVADFRRELGSLTERASLSWLQIDTTGAPPPRTESERRLKEYAGDPAEVAAAAAGHDVLIVHGAPVSAEVLATDGLRLVCCARGGPVNVDLDAATAAGIPVCNTPGKNAEAVAELTIAFALMHIRGIAPSSRQLASGGRFGASVFDGREYFGHEAPSTTLGLVGFGHVGRNVARRARALGFTVLAHDPYVSPAHADGVELVGMEALLGGSDIVSLHARATPRSRGMIGAEQFGAMRPGSFLINTAREQLVDEPALMAALSEGRPAGAALDVVEHVQGDGRNPLLDMPQVIATPHIGGATHETLRRGAEMAAASVTALIAGEVPPFIVNSDVLQGAPLPVPPGSAA